MRILITGGAGFIGANVADHHLSAGDDVVVFDNLSRPGTTGNLDWLRGRHGDRLTAISGDVRDFGAVWAAVWPSADRVYHLAAQVAVTTSVKDPRNDFEVNALGTLNVLEAVRKFAPDAVVVYASTNKVYGRMEDVPIVEGPTRYRYRDHPHGIAEDRPLDFHSPYGCSKGCGDQYVRDYARIYGLRTVVMRQSCIYGTRQFGIEDQGWVAHFCIAARHGRPITIYGDGKQVRDVLWIDDLVAAYQAAADHIDVAGGQVYNIGGGAANTVSAWAEFGPLLADAAGAPIAVDFADWRPGDQPVYVSDIRKAQRDLHWSPQVSLDVGLRRLWNWVDSEIELCVEVPRVKAG
jgi:CDP-paratose 2-epimerase